MDNTQKNPDQDQNQASGEIFNNSPGSSYSAATGLSPEETTSPYAPTQAPETEEVQPVNETIPPEGEGGGYPPDSGINASPPFTEDKKKKLLLIGIILAAFVFVILLAIKLMSRGTAKPEANVNLTYWGLWEDKTITEPIIEEYKKSHPNVNINYINRIPSNIERDCNLPYQGKMAPIYSVSINTWVPMLMTGLAPGSPKYLYPG